MADQFAFLIQAKILASLEAEVPVLTPLEVHVPGLRGKMVVVVGQDEFSAPAAGGADESGPDGKPARQGVAAAAFLGVKVTAAPTTPIASPIES